MAICPFCNQPLSLKTEKLTVTALNRTVTAIVCMKCNKPIGILDSEMATQMMSTETLIQKEIARHNELNQNVEKISNNQ